MTIRRKGQGYEPECLVCHTTGYQHKNGYADRDARTTAWSTSSARLVTAMCTEHARDGEWSHVGQGYLRDLSRRREQPRFRLCEATGRRSSTDGGSPVAGTVWWRRSCVGAPPARTRWTCSPCGGSRRSPCGSWSREAWADYRTQVMAGGTFGKQGITRLACLDRTAGTDDEAWVLEDPAPGRGQDDGIAGIPCPDKACPPARRPGRWRAGRDA